MEIFFVRKDVLPKIRKAASKYEMKFSMRVVMMTLTLRYALSKAGTIVQKAPPRIPAAITAGMRTRAGCPLSMIPVEAAKIAPRMSWPSAPIESTFILKANAVAKDVRINGVACANVSPKPNLEVSEVSTISL